MGGSQSRSESRDGSGRGRYAHSGSFQQPAAPQYPPYGAGQDGYYGAPPPQQGGYAAPYPAYQPAPVATPPARGGGAASKPRTLDRRYSRIADDFQSVEQVRH
jgi:E3 ubiquitin-protein ligase RGLG